MAARRVARPARHVPARQRRHGAVPTLPPVARGALDPRRHPPRRRGRRPAHPALGGVGQVEHHRVDGTLALAPARRGRHADLRQGRRHHRPHGARPSAAGDRRRARTHPRHDRAHRQELGAAQGSTRRQRGPRHHHDAAEVPRRRRTREEGRRRGGDERGGRQAVRRHRRRGAQLHWRRRLEEAQGRPTRRRPARGRGSCAGRSGGSRGGERCVARLREATRQEHEPVVLRVHGHAETEDARTVRGEGRRR